MSITEQYLEALKAMDEWVLVSEWAVKVGELYPDLLEKANQEAANQANDTTGLREIAARISSAIARGSYIDHIEINTRERPRRVRYVSSDEHEVNVSNEIDEDVAPLKRHEIIKLAEQSMSNAEKYRVDELESISKQLKKYFGLEFEVDHAQALLNQERPGFHHPDNLQLILKAHNARKNNTNFSAIDFDYPWQKLKTLL